MARVLVMPSPLLGTAGWEQVCDLLTAHDHEVELVEPAPPRSVAEVLEGFARHLGVRRCLLVGHSNAGNYLPRLLSQAPAGSRAIFVDCEVPPRSSAFGMATGARRDILLSMPGEDGLLPPWPRWWHQATWEELVPDARARDELFGGAPQATLAYFEQPVEAPARWWQASSAYLRFQESFEPQALTAAGYGWPVRRLRGTHLHMVNDPVDTAEALLGLADAVVR